jgi:hypothetical protein
VARQRIRKPLKIKILVDPGLAGTALASFSGQAHRAADSVSVDQQELKEIFA